MGTKALTVNDFDGNLAKVISEKLAEKNATQAELAEHAEISTSRLSRLLRGERPMLVQELNRIAKFLQIKSSDLLEVAEQRWLKGAM